MKIGPVQLACPLVLASMEEHTHYYFRLLMKQHGAALVCGERVDAADVARRDRRALRLLYTLPDESPRSGQISGADPAVMAEAARVVEELGFNLVDLNFECPIRRLLGRGEGGALMADPPAIGRIVQAVVRAVSIPVTVKIRSGPDPRRETAGEVACRAEEAGAAAVEVHARSVEQAYLGGPDLSVIARVKRQVRIAVLGSGGIRQACDVPRFLAESGADAAAIARGCLGNPWIFRQARALLSGGATLPPPTAAQRGRVLVQLIEGEFQLYGPTVARRRLARTSCYYAKFLPDFPAFREAVQKVENLAQFRRLVKEHFR
jgi:nifR3 family TIM-barrel protein